MQNVNEKKSSFDTLFNTAISAGQQNFCNSYVESSGNISDMERL